MATITVSSSFVSAVRAITAVFFRRLLRPILIGAWLLALVLLALTIYLATAINGWWAVLLIIFVPLSVIALGAGGVLWFMAGKLLPRRLHANETRRIRAFTTKLLDVAGQARMPLPLLAASIAKDVVRGRGSQRLEALIADSKSLRTEANDIVHMFS